MASRQEEKEARRRARIEQEEAERRAATRNKRLQLVLGGVLAAGIAAAVVVFAFASGGKDKESLAVAPSSTGAQLPAVELTDEKAAAKAAGCTLQNPPDEGRDHEDRAFTIKDYKTNPPTSGTHFPVPAQEGIYAPGNNAQLGAFVHALEHGRIEVQYKPGTPKRATDQLEEFLAESDAGYHMLMFQNDTGMDAQVAATAWDHSLTCPTVTPQIWDALRTFRQSHIDRGPEKVA